MMRHSNGSRTDLLAASSRSAQRDPRDEGGNANQWEHHSSVNQWEHVQFYTACGVSFQRSHAVVAALRWLAPPVAVPVLLLMISDITSLVIT